MSSRIREVGERERIMNNVKQFLKEAVKQYENMEKAFLKGRIRQIEIVKRDDIKYLPINYRKGVLYKDDKNYKEEFFDYIYYIGFSFIIILCCKKFGRC